MPTEQSITQDVTPPTTTKPLRGRPRRDFDEAQMVAHYRGGYSIGSLAKHYGVAVSTLMASLKRAEVKCRGPGYRQPKTLPELSTPAPT